jgi:hypothetical protein
MLTYCLDMEHRWLEQAILLQKSSLVLALTPGLKQLKTGQLLSKEMEFHLENSDFSKLLKVLAHETC